MFEDVFWELFKVPFKQLQERVLFELVPMTIVQANSWRYETFLLATPIPTSPVNPS